jgi:hypothetical protein
VIKIEATTQDCPPEFVEVYSELCFQFRNAVLTHFRDVGRTTIMRELPPGLQLNAVLTGAFIGGMMPILAITKAADDGELIAALASRLPAMMALARSQADDVMALMPKK